ncbi:hypothetical protein N7481_006712 [Penicillium waksmanii]|uniref:uncharacterized protein n=1 Tax=Penicillium waksmanii TaxID=69791 RepID=UPI0025493CF1|nr:uncharacterized protein N7481_006712 [Penicillium waksmanii]KAJ5984613.1 hypothetical protein N7481_006712 [Penicillium waksmanii]
MDSQSISNKNDLRLDIAAPSSWQYSPGDTIIGNVVRQSPIVSPEATVNIWLTGIMRVRILRDLGTGTNDRWGEKDAYVDKWTLINSTEQAIFNGPLHHPESTEEPVAWPFSASIPSKPKAFITQGHLPQATFLPFDKDHEAFHVLPGSLRTTCDGYSSKSEALVEYRLHAELNYERGGSRRVEYATVPITLRHAPGSIDQKRSSNGGLSPPTKVQSHRLMPGMEDTELSFRQKTKKLFGSSKAPQFWFEIVMKSPPVVQFDNPAPLPIILSIGALKGEGRTSSSIEDIPQRIQINYVKIRIQSWTTVIASGNLTSRAHTDRQSFDVNFHSEDLFKSLESPLAVYSSGKANEPIDIGNMFQLVLRRDGLYTNGKRCSWTLTPTLFPDLLTFAIKHTHQVEYRINLTIAGETLEVKVFAPLKIIEAA